MEAVDHIRGIFSHMLAPMAVLATVSALVITISKVVQAGFRVSNREGCQRLCAAVLPFAFLLYAAVRQHAGYTDGWFDFGNSMLLDAASWQLFLASAGGGVMLAAQSFRRNPDHALRMRLLILVQSTVASFIGYVFICVASAPGMDVSLGVIAGFCGYSIFPTHEQAEPLVERNCVEDESEGNGGDASSKRVANHQHVTVLRDSMPSAQSYR